MHYLIIPTNNKKPYAIDRDDFTSDELCVLYNTIHGFVVRCVDGKYQYLSPTKEGTGPWMERWIDVDMKKELECLLSGY